MTKTRASPLRLSLKSRRARHQIPVAVWFPPSCGERVRTRMYVCDIGSSQRLSSLSNNFVPMNEAECTVGCGYQESKRSATPIPKTMIDELFSSYQAGHRGPGCFLARLSWPSVPDKVFKTFTLVRVSRPIATPF
jgi:hypothetical protein